MASIAPTRRPRTTPASADKTMERLTRARVQLVLHQPFFGTLALHTELGVDDRFPTAATNGKWIKFNPEFAATLTDPELLFVMAHEVMHSALSHTHRIKGRDPVRWNKAGDIVINQYLVDAFGETDPSTGKRRSAIVATMPDGALFDTDLFKAGNGTTDGVYALLPDEGGGGGSGRGPGGYTLEGDVQPADGDGDSDGEAERGAKERLAQARNAAKMAGKMPGGLERLVSDILNPRVNWREVLQQFVVKVRTDERTFARPNRRFASQGLYLPSISGEALGPIVVAVDCSGSITDEILSQFTTEIRVIHEDQRPRELHVVYFDARVSHRETYTPDDTLDIRAHGGGGTAFSPIFADIEARGIEPVCCVVLTDLQCADFGPQPGYPVLWVSNDATDAPWGEVVVM